MDKRVNERAAIAYYLFLSRVRRDFFCRSPPKVQSLAATATNFMVDSWWLVAMERAADAPLLSSLLLRAPRQGQGRDPTAPWSSRWRSGRVHRQRPSRCVRPASHHTARGPGHNAHNRHAAHAGPLAMPHGGQQSADPSRPATDPRSSLSSHWHA